MKVIFETPRLFLRRFTIEDAPLILKLNSDPEVLKYVHEPVLQNEIQAKKILKEIILPQYSIHLGRWAIYTRDAYEFIGWCGLKYIATTQITDLGYRLVKTAWGNGYATEAAQYTLIYGLRELKIKTITGMAHIHNKASIRILEKIGMQFQKLDHVDGIPVRVYTLSLPDITDYC